MKGNSARDIGDALVEFTREAGTYTAKAASRANGVSAAAQSAQGAFNQSSANGANAIGTDRLMEQYGYNSAQAAMANQFSMDMWNRSAEWNEMMWQRQADFNHNEAKLAREWQQMMESTKYQRAIDDMKAAGLNPILAVTGGGVSAGGGAGSAASVGMTSMSPMQGQAASGGLLQGVSASESSYSGQMEYMGGVLGLLSAAIAGMSSAATAIGGLGNVGKTLGDAIGDVFKVPEGTKKSIEKWKSGDKKGAIKDELNPKNWFSYDPRW